jgi:uncharacterized membrane protein YeiH
MPDEAFHVPFFFDYGATFLWGVSGALVAARRGYDIAGIVALALVSATGGGLLRDGLFLQNGPPALVRTPAYLLIVAGAALLVLLIGVKLHRLPAFARLIDTVDALGLGAYAVVGMQLSLEAGLSLPGVVLVGVVNAVGGGVLRDVLMRQDPEIFKPGTLMAAAAMAGCLAYLLLAKGLSAPSYVAAWVTIAVAFVVRTISVRYGVRTHPLPGFVTENETSQSNSLPE